MPGKPTAHVKQLLQGPGKSPSTHEIQHALWVGNIPSETNILDLKDFFLDVTPNDLISLSYNPASRYAFANFSKESARITAIVHAASTLFRENRLDCRIRSEGQPRSVKVSYGLSAGDNRNIAVPKPTDDQKQKAKELAFFPDCDVDQNDKEKFFIIKSFTLEAIRQSLETNLWYIPQRHACRSNYAFRTARKVYFIFSVNGSGELLGYASMESEVQISETPSSPLHDLELPRMRSVELSAKESLVDNTSDIGYRFRTTSPHTHRSSTPGKVIYEPDRRRIIWRASTNSQDSDVDSSKYLKMASLGHGSVATSQQGRWRSKSPAIGTGQSHRSCSCERGAWLPTRHMSDPPPQLQRISAPCQIKWISREQIPFEQVRGIKNPWSEDMNVSRAKNVTPVHPDAGAAILKLWRRKIMQRQNNIWREASTEAWGRR
ncbi:uncharacterized protein A1O5_00552 [Cladophialophora psammophila CBS 110553]|uniref:YTH domain-containing protein n=1 Tax=Cladophialophora psammophila CBS 110553 TaxID=1182543 RepID=W9Y0M4_9EURO|nr:uncharacterized protein A1O5_00552 [Cladophialophora psammophila CBS 110553]EXJ76044.1 hypothetical protein A1O5_00552 [Cladophialophora psammophila CBS 110553]